MGTRERYFSSVNFNPALLICICGNRIGGYDFSRELAFLGMLLISHKSPPLVVLVTLIDLNMSQGIRI